MQQQQQRPPSARHQSAAIKVKHLVVLWLVVAAALTARFLTPRTPATVVGHHPWAHAAIQGSEPNGTKPPRTISDTPAAAPMPCPSWVHEATWWHIDREHHGAARIHRVLLSVATLAAALPGGRLRRKHPVVAVLDHGWAAADDAFRFDPVRYPAPDLGALAGTVASMAVPSAAAADRTAVDAALVGLVVWVSGLLPEGDVAFADAVASGWCVRDGPNGPVHMFDWHHGGGAVPVRGCLLDFSSPEVREMVTDRLRRLLEANPAVMGVRVAGVDALLDDIHRCVNHEPRHYGADDYKRDYYRFFFDAGRLLRGPQFIVVARPVDTFAGRYHFRTFAPPDVTLAGWVGDHPFTFAGMREAAMNMFHSARRGYVSFGSFVGGTPNHAPTDVHAGSGRQRILTERDVYNNNNNDDDEAAAEDAGPLRRLELLLRWSQLAAVSPVVFVGAAAEDVLVVGGGAGGSGGGGASDRVAVAVAAQLLVRHAQLSTYLSTAVARAFARRLLDVDHETPLDKTADSHSPNATVWRPLARDRIFFDAPVDWAVRVGGDLIAAIPMHSFGRRTTLRVPFPEDSDTDRWVRVDDPVFFAGRGSGGARCPREYGRGEVVTFGEQEDAGDAVPPLSTVTFQRVGSLVPLKLRDRLTVFSSVCPRRARLSSNVGPSASTLLPASMWEREPAAGVAVSAWVDFLSARAFLWWFTDSVIRARVTPGDAAAHDRGESVGLRVLYTDFATVTCFLYMGYDFPPRRAEPLVCKGVVPPAASERRTSAGPAPSALFVETEWEAAVFDELDRVAREQSDASASYLAGNGALLSSPAVGCAYQSGIAESDPHRGMRIVAHFPPGDAADVVGVAARVRCAPSSDPYERDW